MQSCQLDRLPVPVSNERRRGQAQQRAAAVRSGGREGTNTGRQHHVDLTRLVGAGEVVALAEAAADRLQRAQLVEVLVALGDDFGTGYSSLSYLGLLDVTARPRARKAGVPNAPSPILSAHPEGMVPQVI
jgi:hypothetical protein